MKQARRKKTALPPPEEVLPPPKEVSVEITPVWIWPNFENSTMRAMILLEKENPSTDIFSFTPERMQEWFPLVFDPNIHETYGKQWASHVVKYYGTAFFRPGAEALLEAWYEQHVGSPSAGRKTRRKKSRSRREVLNDVIEPPEKA